MCSILIVLVFIIPKAFSAPYHAPFGEPCGNDTTCDTFNLMSCIQETCQCLHPTQMRFDVSKNKCLVLNGEKCSYFKNAFGNNKEELLLYERVFEQDISPFQSINLECSDSEAICSPDGYCECNSKHFETLHGNCQKKLSFGENCTESFECVGYPISNVCTDGKCDCNRFEAVYREDLKKCGIFAGHKCSLETNVCVKNSQCRYHGKGLERFCLCNSGFKAVEGSCIGLYGSNCNNDSHCDKGLACTQGKCRCPFQTQQYYDSGINQCVSFVGGRCRSDNSQEYNCVPNATCKNFTEVFHCTCNYGYHPSPHRMCEIEEDNICESKLDYFEDDKCVPKRGFGEECYQNFECRGDLGLICKNDNCTCNASEAIYRPELNRCVGLAGHECVFGACVKNARCIRAENKQKVCKCRQGFEEWKGSCLTPFGGYCGENDLCEDGLKCSSGRCICPSNEMVYDEKTSKCQCPSGFEPERTNCVLGFEMGCNSTKECLNGLVCTEGKCLCPFPFNQYFNSLKSCTSLIRGPCNETISGEFLQFDCIEGAECKEIDGVSECVCKSGYAENERRECTKNSGVGEDCSGNLSCDASLLLICRNGTCTCKDFREFDKDRNKCVGLVGAPCKPGKVGECVDGADCEELDYLKKCSRRNENEYCSKFDIYRSVNGVCRCEAGKNNVGRKCN